MISDDELRKCAVLLGTAEVNVYAELLAARERIGAMEKAARAVVKDFDDTYDADCVGDPPRYVSMCGTYDTMLIQALRDSLPAGPKG